MQYKKKEVADKILDAAREEFLAKGYKNANIVSIAEEAGVPVGNLYRYFSSKHDLLDAVVGETVKKIPHLVTQIESAESDGMPLELFMVFACEALMQVFEQYGKELVILSSRCAQTKYEDFVENLNGHILKVVTHKMYGDNISENDSKFGAIITKSFMSSMFELLRLAQGREELQELTFRMLKFYFYEIEKRTAQ
ncbi:MAG: TetR/AcrR family transcriptional regulator [Firmicutes bacterium]|nr:TetR/AcrR family transcriptional regulator [Bacillota bacterium]